MRRRVESTLARAMRRAVLLSAPLLIVLLAADAAQDLLRGSGGARANGMITVVEMLVVLAGAIVVRRGARSEPVAMTLLLAVYVATVVERGVVGAAADLSLAYLAMVLLASGLFLPWDPRWHVAWLTAALVITVVAAGAGAFGSADAGVSALVAAGMASVASGLGHSAMYARLRRGLEQQFELRALTRLATRQGDAVAQLNEDLSRAAHVDAMTGLGNRRALDDALATLAGRRLAAILLDLDHFKAYNDRLGHLAGDAALTRVGMLLQRTVRAGDLVFRYGGEEFLVLVPGGELDGARQLAERMRAAIRDDEQTGGDRLTLSAGVAVADRFSSADPMPLLRLADAALYQAKRNGRDQVVVSGESAAARAAHAAAG